MPAAACVAPIPAGRSSMISTEAPRRASSYAIAQPTTPAPTTTMSRGGATRESYVKIAAACLAVHVGTSSPGILYAETARRQPLGNRDPLLQSRNRARAAHRRGLQPRRSLLAASLQGG